MREKITFPNHAQNVTQMSPDKCITDQCNDDIARDIVPQTKLHMFNLPQLIHSLDPVQARHFVGPDLSPNFLERLSADDTSRQRVKVGVVIGKVSYHWGAGKRQEKKASENVVC